MHGGTMLSLQDLPDRSLSSDSFLLLFFCSTMVTSVLLYIAYPIKVGVGLPFQ